MYIIYILCTFARKAVAGLFIIPLLQNDIYYFSILSQTYSIIHHIFLMYYTDQYVILLYSSKYHSSFV
jgi:hypothetical protein